MWPPIHSPTSARNCCNCTDRQSCARDHSKVSDQSICQPARCKTSFDFDCTGRDVDCFVDEDCDGQVNEDGEGCYCTPSTQDSCYAGDPAKAGVGICALGQCLCNSTGTACETACETLVMCPTPSRTTRCRS